MLDPLARERVTYVFFVADASAMNAPTLVRLRSSPEFRALLDRGCKDIDYKSQMVPGGLDVSVTFLCPARMPSA